MHQTPYRRDDGVVASPPGKGSSRTKTRQRAVDQPWVDIGENAVAKTKGVQLVREVVLNQNIT